MGEPLFDGQEHIGLGLDTEHRAAQARGESMGKVAILQLVSLDASGASSS